MGFEYMLAKRWRSSFRLIKKTPWILVLPFFLIFITIFIMLLLPALFAIPSSSNLLLCTGLLLSIIFFIVTIIPTFFIISNNKIFKKREKKYEKIYFKHFNLIWTKSPPSFRSKFTPSYIANKIEEALIHNNIESHQKPMPYKDALKYDVIRWSKKSGTQLLIPDNKIRIHIEYYPYTGLRRFPINFMLSYIIWIALEPKSNKKKILKILKIIDKTILRDTNWAEKH